MKYPSIDITIFFFGDQIILYGDHFTAEGRQKANF